MRFTQFGHHVPRKNSRISAPFSIRPLRVNVPSRLAAPREKSGAREPISRVSVRFFMLSSTVGEMEIGNNNGWGTGDEPVSRLILGGEAVYRMMQALAEKLGSRCPAPKGASDFEELTASLERCTDTKREFFGILFSG